MITEIVDVLTRIAENYNNKVPQDTVFKKFIKQKKYKESLVATAYSWFYEKEKKNVQLNKRKNRVRFFNEMEHEVLGNEIINYLMHLNCVELLSAEEIDNIIDKLLDLPEEKISIESINVLILSLYLDPEEFALPGSRFHLFFYDKIN